MQLHTQGLLPRYGDSGMLGRAAGGGAEPEPAVAAPAVAGGAVDEAALTAAFTSLNPPTARQSALLAGCMPNLAGAPLAPPVFLPVSWTAGQRFSAEDDPCAPPHKRPAVPP